MSILEDCDGRIATMNSLPPNRTCFSSSSNCVRGLMAFKMCRPQSDRDLSGAMFWSSSLGAGVMTLTGVRGA